MASVAVYSSRSRANERVGRLRKEMDRSSGYTLSNLNESTLMGKYSSSSMTSSSAIIPSSITLSTSSSSSSNVSRRPPRDSSIGALGRSNRETSLTRVGSIRLGDTSLPRMKEVALPSYSAASAAAQAASRIKPLDNGLGSETARYARENAIKEIHNNFMKSYKDTNDKINNRAVDEQGERRSKAYAKIMGTSAAVNFISEEEVKKQCISEMFMETNRFSTKTLAAVTSLENFDTRKKKDYNWRKAIEEYESSGQMERDVRARNIAIAVGKRETAEIHRKREIQDNDDGDIWAVKKAPRKPEPEPEVARPERKALETTQIRKPETTQVRKAEPAAPKAAEVRKPEPARQPEPAAAVAATPTEPRKSWRDNHPEKTLQRKQESRTEKEQLLQALQQQRVEQQQRLLQQQKLEQQQKQEQQQSSSSASNDDEAADKPEEMKVDEPAAAAVADDQPAGEGEAQKPAEEDEDGMKKMRKDFFANMSSLDEEFEAGRSKLAKLRERIRRAKGAIKDADAALQASS